jgi:hypothetical protein
MTSDATPAPGSMTVPLLHGWQGLVVLLVAVVVVAVAFLMIGVMRSEGTSSSEWESWLESRSLGGSAHRDEPSAGEHDVDGRLARRSRG